MPTSFSNAQREEARRLDEEIRERAILEGRRARPANGKDQLHASQQSPNGGLHKANGADLPFLPDHQSGQAKADEGNHIKAWPIMESRAAHGIVGRIARLAT